MQALASRHASVVTAVLSGFDRLVFRGTLVALVRPRGMHSFLVKADVRLLDFKEYVEATSQRVKEACLHEAVAQGRPIRYLQASHVDEEDLARRLLREHPVDEGLTCAFRTVEPCMSFEYHLSPDRQERGLRLRPRKCLHVHQYRLDRTFGFMGARLQTWFPFNVQVWVNGREWLARQLARRGRDGFLRHDNCFTRLDDPDLAQRLMDGQLTVDWARTLDRIARSLNPLHARVFQPWPQHYYWSAYQSEWATDVLFRDPGSLAAVYPALVRHATLHFQSPDVLRFLERKPHGNFTGQLTSSFKHRPEGVRVKHRVHGNSVKMHDKAGSVLRVETTIANTADFKVFRPLQDDPAGGLAWRPLRKGVADLHRRAQVSQRANERYLEALAAVSDPTPLGRVLDAVCRPTCYRGRRVRALRIGDPADVRLLRAISRGELVAAGFRNRDLRSLLHPGPAPAAPADARRLAARVTRKIRLLRAHGLVRKLARTHRYQLTDKGRQLAAAVFALRAADLRQVLAMAARESRASREETRR